MAPIHLGFGRDKIIAVVDASEGGAGVAIISCPQKGPATMLAENRSTLVLEKRRADHSGRLAGQHIRQAGEQAMRIYRAAGHTAPITTVYVIVHAPWVRTKAIHSGATLTKETVVTDGMIAEYAKQALANDGDVDSALLLEASVVHVRLNGYATPEPIGKKAHTVDVVSLASECHPSVRASIEHAVQDIFPAVTPLWRSGLRALMTVARESDPSREYLILDIGSESTSIFTVHDDAVEQASLTEGTRSILERIAGGKPLDDTLSSLRMIARDACTPEQCEVIRTAMGIAETELARVFGEVLGTMAAKRRVSNHIFLATHPDLESWMSTFFSRIDFAQFTVTSMPFSVLTPSDLDMQSMIVGSQHTDALTVGAALVNIECTS